MLMIGSNEASWAVGYTAVSTAAHGIEVREISTFEC